MKKNVISMVLMLVVAVAMITGGTMAWFTASAETPNAIFTAGVGTVGINVDLLTQGQQSEIGTVINNNWTPGTTTTVSWKVKNTGAEAMAFRIKPHVTIQRLRQDFDYSKLPPLPNPWNGENLLGRINNTGAPEANWIIEKGSDNRDWNQHVYYYAPVVEAGQEVTLSMDVTLKGEETGNEYQAATFIIGGVVEAVQAAGNAPFEIWGVNYYSGYTPEKPNGTYYVDKNNPQASDENPGTESKPFATIPYAISKLQPGNTLYVKEGTYPGIYVAGLTGTADARINILAYPGDSVSIYGNGVNSGRVKFSNCHYVLFSGFEVTNLNQGIFIEGGSDHITLDKVNVHHVGQEGIHIWNNSSYITVQDSQIHDVRQWQYNGEGLYIGTGSSGALDNTNHVTIKNCTIYNCTDEGIDLKAGTYECILEGNTIYGVNTLLPNNVGAIEVGPHTLGNQNWGSNPNHIIRNNVIHNVKCGITLETGTMAYNNVVYGIASDGYGILVRNSANDTYTRQIYYNTLNVPSDRAVYSLAGSTNIKNNLGPVTGANMAAADSYFISVAVGSEDFHLVGGSAPVDAGTNVGIDMDISGLSRPQGNGYDYGAYELGGNIPTPTATPSSTPTPAPTPTPVGPATYYLDNDDPNATNTNPGTEVAPWMTIAYALSQLHPGDTLYIKEGNYTGEAGFFYASGLSGSADDWINILEYPGHNVKLSGLGVTTGRIKFTGCNYIRFSGFEVTGYNQGIFIEGGSSNMILDNLEVHHVGQEAIHIQQNSSYITVEKSSVHDTCIWKNNGEGFYIGTGSSGALDNTHHITVRNNTIYNVTDEAVELKPGTHDCVVDGNTIYNACTNLTAYYVTGAICVNPHTAGNQFWGENPNHIICNNIVHSTATSGIELRTGCKAYNNVIYGITLANAKGIAIRDMAGDGYTRYVYHNTIHLGSASAIYAWEGIRDIRNNIGPATANNITTSDTYYVDAVSGNFHLAGGSAPVNAGQDVGIGADINGVSRPKGTGFDYGAYEYVE